MRAIADLRGGPVRVAARHFGGTTATVCGVIPAAVLNRVFAFTRTDADRIADIGRLHEDLGAAPVLGIAPNAVTPFREDPNALQTLTDAGYPLASFHQQLYRALPPTTPLPVAACS